MATKKSNPESLFAADLATAIGAKVREAVKQVGASPSLRVVMELMDARGEKLVVDACKARIAALVKSGEADPYDPTGAYGEAARDMVSAGDTDSDNDGANDAAVAKDAADPSTINAQGNTAGENTGSADPTGDNMATKRKAAVKVKKAEKPAKAAKAEKVPKAAKVAKVAAPKAPKAPRVVKWKADPTDITEATCPRVGCGKVASDHDEVIADFGVRQIETGKYLAQSFCRDCRAECSKAKRAEYNAAQAKRGKGAAKAAAAAEPEVKPEVKPEAVAKPAKGKKASATPAADAIDAIAKPAKSKRAEREEKPAPAAKPTKAAKKGAKASAK